MWSLRGILTTAAWALMLVMGASCSREPAYSQSSPQAVLETAKLMVRNGDARLLVKLVHSDSEPMKRALNRLGHTLASMQTLAVELERAFPKEVAKLREDARKSAGAPLGSLLGGLNRGQMQRAARQAAASAPQQGRPEAGAGNRSASPFDDVLTRLFTSPFDLIEDESARLSTVALDNDSHAILYNNMPIIPGVALIIRRDERDGRWYFVLPLDLPALRNVVFRSEEAWRTYTGVIATLDNIVKDLTQDVRSGKLASLNDASRAAGEKAFTSLPFALLALDRLTAAERKRQSGS